MRIYGAPEYKTEVMLLGEGSYDLESGTVELLIWLQVWQKQKNPKKNSCII